jgi:hypothetical protein
MVSVISQNIFLFLASPIFQAATNMPDEDFEKFVAHRKQENVTCILNSLRP